MLIFSQILFKRDLIKHCMVTSVKLYMNAPVLMNLTHFESHTKVNNNEFLFFLLLGVIELTQHLLFLFALAFCAPSCPLLEIQTTFPV